MKIWQAYNISSPILITGETGTGKSFYAKKIFENSLINKEKFLTLHMACIKDELLESELFGHKKGSFTGAIDSRSGYLKETGEGTLFIDEIGELSLESQKKLLYLLEENTYTAVGESVPQKFKGRIILATNKKLKEMVEQKTFREDLYFRISTFQVELEPIRKNKSKTLEIIKNEFEIQKTNCGKAELRLSEELLSFLESYSWPGNYREIKNTLLNMVALTKSIEIGVDQLPNRIKLTLEEVKDSNRKGFDEFYLDSYGEALEKFEEYYLRRAIIQFKGKINETAKKTGISKSALIYKSKKYGINSLKIRAELSDFKQSIAA